MITCDIEIVIIFFLIVIMIVIMIITTIITTITIVITIILLLVVVSGVGLKKAHKADCKRWSAERGASNKSNS